MGIVDMAIHVGLGDYIILAHYIPIEKAHPSMISIIQDKNSNSPTSNPNYALMVSHKLMIELLILQHKHFGLAYLRELIGRCLQDFETIWKKKFGSLEE